MDISGTLTLKQEQIEAALTEALAQQGFAVLGRIKWGTESTPAPVFTGELAPRRCRRSRPENERWWRG